MPNMRKVVAFLSLFMTPFCFISPPAALAQGGPPPGPPMGLVGMPPSILLAPGDSVAIPVDFFAPVPVDSQVSAMSMTIRRDSPDFTFLSVDTTATSLAGWVVDIAVSDDSVRVEATAPASTFYVKPDGPPASLFHVFGALSSTFAVGDSIELSLENVSLVSKGNFIAFPDSEFMTTRIFAGSPPPPPPPPPSGKPMALIAMPPAVFMAPGDSVLIPLEVLEPVPVDSQVSAMSLTIRADKPGFTFLSVDTSATSLKGWAVAVAIGGDSLHVDATAPASTFYVKPQGPPASLFHLSGALASTFAMGDSLRLHLEDVSLVSKGVLVAFPDSEFFSTTIMTNTPPPPPPPGGGNEGGGFAFLDTNSKPDSAFVLEFAALDSIPADSELSRIHVVATAVPPLLDWDGVGQLVATELSGWTLTTSVAGDSLTFDLAAPAGEVLSYAGGKPLVLASFSGKVQGSAPPDANILVRAKSLSLTVHNMVIPFADSLGMVRPGMVMLGTGGHGGPPPPPPPAATSDGRSNLGLYGGTVFDFAYDDAHDIVLAAVAAPQSVFMSADSGLTWSPAFPTDSLEFFTGSQTRGFGGRAMQVESSDGYSYARTSQEAGTLTGTQVTEDGETWRTLLDPYMAGEITRKKFGNGSGPLNIEALSTHGAVALVAAGNYVFRTTDAGHTWNISVLPSASAATSSRIVKAVDVHRDDPTGMGFYASMSESFDRPADAFYRTEDGVTFTPIFVVSGADTADAIRAFVSHPLASDTLWVSAMSLSNPGMNGIWRSYDAGATWTQIYPAGDPFNVPSVTIYQDVAYSGPDNIRLLLVGENKYSDDLGDSWTAFTPQNDMSTQRVSNANAGLGHITGTDIYFSQGDGAPARSTTGLEGVFSFVPTGIEGITIWDIAQVPNDMDKVYLATSVGIAYTSRFRDTTLTTTEKWAAPVGNYPINPNGGGNMGFTAIAIDPNNTDHVIAANGNGLFVTTTGGLTNGDWGAVSYNTVSGLDEPTFKGQGGRVNQITFVTSDSVIAALYTERMLYGALILSTDGGNSWATMPQAGNHNFRTVVTAWSAARDSLVLFAAGGGVANDPGTMSTAVDTGGLYKSLDRGATWVRVAITPSGTFNPAPFPLPVNEIAIKPGSLDTLYMACGENLSNAIVRTYDGGVTLESIGMAAVGAREGAFEAVAINKVNPDSIYFAVRRDILVYDAASDKATTLFRGYPGELTHTLLYDQLTMGSSAGFYEIEAQPTTPTSVEDTEPTVPARVALAQNYPNPFNPSTTIRYYLPQDGTVKLEIFNILGQRVEQLLADKRTAGEHTLTWQPSGLSSGVYFYRLRVTFSNGREEILSRKLMFLK